MRSMKFFFFIVLGMQLSEAAFAKAEGRDSKHYENSFSKDLTNDFGEIFYQWKKANENIASLEEDSFDAHSVDKNI